VNSMTMGLIVLACVFGGALFGRYLSTKVAAHHLSADSKDAMTMALGVIGTLASLVLGLLLSSAKSSFDAKGQPDVGRSRSARPHPGPLRPETRDARDLLRNSVAAAIQRVWPEEELQVAKLDTIEAAAGLETVEGRVQDLSPRTDAQRGLQSRALSIISEIAQEPVLMLERHKTRIPIPFLIVLAWWSHRGTRMDHAIVR
jgi:hypothetical protein